jgi:hypothetical protein
VQATARVRWRGRVVVVTNYRHKDATPHMPAACSCSFYTPGRLGDVWETMAVLWGGVRLVLLGLPNSFNKPIRCDGLIGAYTHSTISCVCFFSHSAGPSALKFSAGDAQPASDGELCRRGMKRDSAGEVDLTMPLCLVARRWMGVGGLSGLDHDRAHPHAKNLRRGSMPSLSFGVSKLGFSSTRTAGCRVLTS